jgi:hypothetical protein
LVGSLLRLVLWFHYLSRALLELLWVGMLQPLVPLLDQIFTRTVEIAM